VVNVTPRPIFNPGKRPGTHCIGGWVGSRNDLNGFRKSRSHRIMSMKNSSVTIENRTRVLPAFNAVPQPTAPPHVSRSSGDKIYCIFNVGIMLLCVVRFSPSDKRSVRIALSKTKFFRSPLKYCMNNKFRFDKLIFSLFDSK
jgi:hypothetical protein